MIRPQYLCDRLAGPPAAMLLLEIKLLFVLKRLLYASLSSAGLAPDESLSGRWPGCHFVGVAKCSNQYFLQQRGANHLSTNDLLYICFN